MRKSIILIFLLPVCLYGQAPEKINYQAVVRDASGNVVINTAIYVTLTITDGTTPTPNTYKEKYTLNKSIKLKKITD